MKMTVESISKVLAVGASVVLVSACASTQKSGEPGEVQLSADSWRGRALIIPGYVNYLDQPVTGEIRWRINGAEQPEAQQVGFFALPDKILQPDADYEVTPYEGDNVIDAVFNLSPTNGMGEEIKLKKTYHIYGINKTAEPPTIDGEFTGDWNDPALVKIDPAYRMNTATRPAPGQPFSVVVRAKWDDKNLYIGIEVADETPLMNDSVTLYTEINGEHFFSQVDLADESMRNMPGGLVAKETDGGYIYEMAMPFTHAPDENSLVPFNLKITNGNEELVWQGSKLSQDDLLQADHGLAAFLPDPSTLPSSGGRKQLHGGETEVKKSDVATKDPSYLTPLPVEYPDGGTYLPEGIELKFPAEGSWEIEGAYGYENRSWTHQTIDNRNSANDFFALDVKMPEGTPILAVAPGRLIQSGLRGDSYGNYIVIDHGQGIHSIYAHLSEIIYEVHQGQPEIYVDQGTLLGLSGQTGTSRPHLHFGIHQGSRVSHSGANVGGKTVVPEPLSGYYGIRAGHVIESDNRIK